MAMKRLAPWWLTWGLPLALIAVFLGERVIGDGGMRTALSGAGALYLLVALGWRAYSWSGARGDRKRVEGILLLGYVGVAMAIGLYFLFAGDKPSKATTVVAVLWPILLTSSLLPTLAAQLALGHRLAAAAADADSSHAEAHRVSEQAWAGLSVAFALSLLCIVMYIANERDSKIDVSYFKTSSPGSAMVNMVNTLDEPLVVELYFPPVNEVKDEVRAYFDELARTTKKVEIKEVDRMVEAKLAEEHRVQKDGTIVLVKGDRFRAITVDTKIKQARAKLRDLDTEVQKAFMKVATDARTAYMLIGHGELNDPLTKKERGRDPFYKTRKFDDVLKFLNYRVKDLGVAQGLEQQVPDDCTLLVALGPTAPLSDAELASIDKYLAGGGAMFLALEPGTEVVLGQLEGRLGVKFDPTLVADDKEFAIERRSDSDHANLVTYQFSSHASVTTMSRTSGLHFVLKGAGSLEDAEFAADWGDKKPKRSYVVKSRSTSFRDANGNFLFDEGEQRKTYNLIAAIEGPKPPARPDNSTKAPGEPMRVMVLGDSQLLADYFLGVKAFALNTAFVLDALKWLGGKEKWTGEVKSEKDVPLQHTKKKDKVWFYGIIIGAPLLVLGLGLGGIRLRRRRRKSA